MYLKLSGQCTYNNHVHTYKTCMCMHVYQSNREEQPQSIVVEPILRVYLTISWLYAVN